MDIAILVDSSGSILSEDIPGVSLQHTWDLMKATLEKLVDNFEPLNENKNQITVIQFADTAKIQFPLDKYEDSNIRDMHSFISRMEYRFEQHFVRRFADHF